MSFDNSIRAIAYAEAATLGSAIALIAKHRMDVDAAVRAAELKTMPVATEGAATERAIQTLAATVETHKLDKLA